MKQLSKDDNNKDKDKDRDKNKRGNKNQNENKTNDNDKDDDIAFDLPPDLFRDEENDNEKPKLSAQDIYEIDKLKEKLDGPKAKCGCCGESVGMKNVSIINNTFLCNECLRKYYEQAKEKDAIPSLSHYEQDQKTKMDLIKTYTKEINPHELVKFLDKHIIGQDYAKKTLSAAVANHYKRIRRLLKTFDDCYSAKKIVNMDIDVEKDNILILGQSGVGKTAILKALAKKLDIPFAVADASSLTSSGFVGADVDTIIQNLFIAADRNPKKTEYGIIFLDEFDKLARKSGANASVSDSPRREAVQQELLKLIEGKTLGLSLSLETKKRVNPESPIIPINTENILFICGGAFEGIEKIIAKRINASSKGLGFQGSINKEKEITEYNELISKVIPEDFIQFGIIPELVGRLPIECYLKQFTREQLIEIMTAPQSSIIKQYTELFGMDGLEFEATHEALCAIADTANKQKTGARALRTIIAPALVDAMYDVKSLSLEAKENNLKIKIVLDYDESQKKLVTKIEKTPK